MDRGEGRRLTRRRSRSRFDEARLSRSGQQAGSIFIRLGMNLLAHGIGWSEMVVDLTLSSKQRSLVIDVARPSEYENIIARN